MLAVASSFLFAIIVCLGCVCVAGFFFLAGVYSLWHEEHVVTACGQLEFGSYKQRSLSLLELENGVVRGEE